MDRRPPRQPRLPAPAWALLVAAAYLVLGGLWFATAPFRLTLLEDSPWAAGTLVRLDPFLFLALSAVALALVVARGAGHVERARRDAQAWAGQERTLRQEAQAHLQAHREAEAALGASQERVHQLARKVREGFDPIAGPSEDASARREADARLRQLKDELEQRVADRTAQLRAANRELEAFSYSVSHDLHGPLQTIDGFSAILLEDHAEALDEDARHLLERVRAASQRMGSLLDALLGLSRITRRSLRREPVDVSAMATAIVDELARREPGRSVAWHVADDLAVQGDPELVQVLLENLLANAWKFTRQAAAPSISVYATRQRGERVFVVEDNGAGFDMAQASRLFKPFQRLHAEDAFEGTGIGLATVQRIVARHGGRIWAEGAIDEGARFFFTLPEKPGAAGEQATSLQPTGAQGETGAHA